MSAVAGSTRRVTIPARVEHDGYHCMTVELPWTCLRCGGPRGEPFKTVSYDGSRRLEVDGWHNACGHVEQYGVIRAALETAGAIAAARAAPMTDAQYVACGGNQCPFCGSLEISAGRSDVSGIVSLLEVRCAGCGQEWEDHYTLTGYSKMETP